jgi:hypothetical protein
MSTFVPPAQSEPMRLRCNLMVGAVEGSANGEQRMPRLAVVATQHTHFVISPWPVAARLTFIQPALFQMDHEAVRAEAYDLSRMRHRHAAIDQADGLANHLRVEPADTARSTMRFGNERDRPSALEVTYWPWSNLYSGC